MRIAVISDIHGNLPALQAVFEDINREKVDQIKPIYAVLPMTLSPWRS